LKDDERIWLAELKTLLLLFWQTREQFGYQFWQVAVPNRRAFASHLESDPIDFDPEAEHLLERGQRHDDDRSGAEFLEAIALE
jgi:hypothetical protein